MLNHERKIVEHKYFYCQRCAEKCFDKPIMAAHEFSGTHIKICKYCNELRILEMNDTSLMFTAG